MLLEVYGGAWPLLAALCSLCLLYSHCGVDELLVFLSCIYKGLRLESGCPESQIAESCRCITTYLHLHMSPWILLKTCHLVCWSTGWLKKHHRKTDNSLTHALQRLWIFWLRDLKALHACSLQRTLLNLSSLASITSSFETHTELKDCFVCKGNN